MSDHSSSKLDQQTSESLWAISDEGIIWQINPLSRDAAPVLHLDELPARERLSFQQYIMRGWAGKQERDSVPEDIERFVREICLARRHRQ